MEIIITAILSVIATAIITALLYRSRTVALKSRLEAELENAERNLKSLKESYESQISSLKESHSRLDNERMNQMERERRNTERRMEDTDRQWQLRFDRLKEEILNLNNALLLARQEKLQDTNRSQIAELLQPVREQFDAFRKSVEATRTAGEVSKEELKQSFENTLKLFSQQQQMAVKALSEQTQKIGNDAENLTRVLKRDSKVQGDWGEMILETLLESSGLERDTHFFVQENVKDEYGRNFRPDVIVRFPEGRSVIIDSKASLTSYADSFDAPDDATRKIKLKEHARSVRKHVDELAAKKYDELVSDSIGLVLMFIPNDQCYLSAIEEDKELTRYAYAKGIVIISPSNLMIALQLAFNLWQQDRQTKNVETIVKTATELYEKVALFSDTIEDLEIHISRLNDSFAKAKNQMFEGKGNIFRRIENLKDLGISPKRKIKGLQ
ncbi:MAG: DNA recombination protein RmuC [Muribaculaceae bacterium]|nr:DNA recombination protein RmuC [Muribaculaceae bacterium]